MTNQQWAILVLQDGGYPVTQNNIDSMLIWMTAENSPQKWTGTAGANNPLNNGLGSGGGDGTGSYPDLTVAASYAAAAMHGGVAGMAAADAAFAQSASPSATIQGLIASNWTGNNHYSGTNWATAGSVPIVDTTATSLRNIVVGNGAPSPANVGFWQQLGGDIAGGITGSIPGASQAIALEQTLQKGATLLTSLAFWERVGTFTLGAAIATIGLVLLVSTSKTGQKVVSEGAPIAAMAAA